MRILALEKAEARFLTGLIYVNPEAPSLVDMLQLVDTPLVQLGEDRIRPTRETLDKVLQAYL
ncbi:hypothetical protein D3C72_2410930 [compost metagenome]